jgi:hypothetical protein
MARAYFLDTNGCCIVLLFSLLFFMFCVLRHKIDKYFVTNWGNNYDVGSFLCFVKFDQLMVFFF